MGAWAALLTILFGQPATPALLDPLLGPLQPVLDPLQPVLDPLQPVLDPLQPVLDPLQPVLDPLQPVLDPLQPLTDPLLGSQGLVGGLLGKLSEDVQELVGGPIDTPVAVIVQTYDPPDTGLLGGVLGLVGGLLETVFTVIPGYAATVPAGSLLQLAADPNVERISLDVPVRAHMDVAARAVRADRAASLAGLWGTRLTGKGVGIALIDTGAQMHQDLKRPLLARQMLEIEIVERAPGYNDPFGHGTHVAGILGGTGAASSDYLSFRTFRGLAPEAHIISVRALAADGSGSTSDVIEGIDWVVRNARAYNIRVLNLSLGHPVYESYRTDPLCRAVATAVRKGIVVVVAAGNDGAIGTGFGTITSPGNSPYAITVGATDDQDTVALADDTLAGYSSKGPSLVDFVVKPDLVAPGTWIVSTRAPASWLDTEHHELTLRIGDYRNDPLRFNQDGAYYSLAGTSVAAPIVSGAVALMLQRDPTLTPATVKARLMKSAVKDDRLVFETGAGTLDVYGAVTATGIALSPLSPVATLVKDGLILVQDPASLWGAIWSQTAIWGGKKAAAYGLPLGVSGTQSIVENPSVTGTGAIWGGARSSLLSTTGEVSGQSAIWGGSRYRR